jgi:uncharacterized protein YerC
MGKQINQRVVDGLATPEKIIEMHAKLDFGVDEYCTFQELKSLAQASGKLTFEEATTIYAYLGESVTTLNAQPVAVKVVLTKVLQELLAQKINGQRAA